MLSRDHVIKGKGSVIVPFFVATLGRISKMATNSPPRPLFNSAAFNQGYAHIERQLNIERAQHLSYTFLLKAKPAQVRRNYCTYVPRLRTATSCWQNFIRGDGAGVPAVPCVTKRSADRPLGTTTQHSNAGRSGCNCCKETLS